MEVSIDKIIDWLRRINWEMKLRYADLIYRHDDLSPSAILSIRKSMDMMAQLKIDVIKKLIEEGYAVVDCIHVIKDVDYYYISVANRADFHIPLTPHTTEIFYLDENNH